MSCNEIHIYKLSCKSISCARVLEKLFAENGSCNEISESILLCMANIINACMLNPAFKRKKKKEIEEYNRSSDNYPIQMDCT